MSESWRLRLLYAIAGAVAWFALRVCGLRRRVIRGNLQRSFPGLDVAELRRIEREFARRQGELAAELLYSPYMGAAELRARVELLEPEVLAGAAAPRPLVLSGTHHGNFEWMLQRVSLELGADLLALYKPLRNARADAWFRRHRTRYGARLVPAKSVLAELAQFRTARAIGLLADQAPTSSPDKHWTRFLEQDTAFYMGAELLGRALRSQVVLVRVERIARGRYRAGFEALNQPGERTASGEISDRYAQGLERIIRDDPPGWWWSHQRWKRRRPRPPA